MKNTARFSDRVENYVKYRPHYPAGIIPYLERRAGLATGKVVADIGSGTGISSLPFLENGNKVLGVEPNTEMREMAEKLLQSYAGFTAVAGEAEHTTLPDASVDLIVAGQAFHWFNREETKKEFKRIARQDCYVSLIWNERRTSEDFEKEYEDIIRQYGIDYVETDHRNISATQIAAFFAPATCEEHTFGNSQVFDLPGLKGRLLSSSYSPKEGHPSYAPMISRLEEIFGRYSRLGMVKFHYVTKLFTGRIWLPI